MAVLFLDSKNKKTHLKFCLYCDPFGVSFFILAGLETPSTPTSTVGWGIAEVVGIPGSSLIVFIGGAPTECERSRRTFVAEFFRPRSGTEACRRIEGAAEESRCAARASLSLGRRARLADVVFLRV